MTQHDDTGQQQRSDALDLLSLDLAAGPSFRSLEDVTVAAASLMAAASPPVVNPWAASSGDGRSFRLVVTPGALCAEVSDPTRIARRDSRDADAQYVSAAQLALWTLDDLGYAGSYGYGESVGPLDPPQGPAAGVIASWSARSRARMFQTIPQLDLSWWAAGDSLGYDAALGYGEPTAYAMLTVTLPGDWQAVAPTGAVFKRLLDRLRGRFRKAGLRWVCLWKLEFQGRGAPHWHALFKIPAMVGDRGFEAWFSETWASVVGADDTVCHGWGGIARAVRERWGGYVHVGGEPCTCIRKDTERRRHEAAGTGVDYSYKMTDPRRIATYFLGHSSKHTDGKEYQHVVPAEWTGDGAGPGRFWGYCGLQKARVGVDVAAGEFFAARRMLRHVARARAWVQAQKAAAYGRTKPRRPLRSLGYHGALTGGTVVVNDGVALAYGLGRALLVRRTSEFERPMRDGLRPGNRLTTPVVTTTIGVVRQ